MCTSTTRHSSFSKLKHKIHNKQAWHSQKAFFFYSFSFGSQCLHPSRPKYSNFLTTFRPELCSVEHWEEFLGSSCPCCCCVNHSYSLLNATYFQSCLQILFVSRQLNEKQPAVGMEGWRGRLTEGQRNVIIRIRNCMWLLCYHTQCQENMMMPNESNWTNKFRNFDRTDMEECVTVVSRHFLVINRI